MTRSAFLVLWNPMFDIICKSLGDKMKMKKKRKFNINTMYISVLIIVTSVLCTTIYIYKAYPNSRISVILRPIFEEKPDVILDAGHGGYDSGSQYHGIYEKDVALALTLDVGKILEEKGVKVAYTRNSDYVFWPSDESKDLKERVTYINKSNASYLISIHTNASEQKQGEGFEIWADTQNKTSFLLAKKISSNVESISFIKQRGIKHTSTLYMIRYSDIPSILIEAGFLESENDRNYLLNEKKRFLLAKKIADGIVDKINEDVE